jgi:hypothetical protein
MERGQYPQGHALTLVLERARQEPFAAVETARRNSFRKAVIEQEILLTLRRLQVPVSNSDLLAAARTVRYNLMPATFRSHLHRLKAKGLIKSAETKRGYWVLADQTNGGQDQQSPHS